MKDDAQHKLFYELIQKSELGMPSTEFEDKVMHRINLEREHQAELNGNIRLSVICLIIATALSVGLFMIPLQDLMYFGKLFSLPSTVFQYLFLVIIFTQLTQLKKYKDSIKSIH